MKTQALLILMCFVGITAYSQKHRPIGFVPFEAKIPNKNPFLEPKTEQEKKEQIELDSVFLFPEQYSHRRDKKEPKLKTIIDYEQKINALSDFGKSQYYIRRALILSTYDLVYDSAIFNYNAFYRNKGENHDVYSSVSSNEEFKRITGLFTIKGTNLVLSDFEKCASLTANKKQIKYVNLCIVDYALESKFLDVVNKIREVENFFEHFKKIEELEEIPNYLSNVNEKDLDVFAPLYDILKKIYEAYKFTKFNGETAYFTVTPSSNFKYDRDGFWLGGEIAIDFNAIRNPYKIDKLTPTSRISLMHVGINQLLDQSEQREFYFGFLRINGNGGLYFKIIQFGFIQNLDDSNRNAWFYRPQIGFAFGHFQLYYSYTAVFNKELRELAPKHAINLRFAMPYFRVSRYDRSFLF
jgi:hypothetical protein